MATETSLRYTKIDYQAHKDALLQRVRARYPRVWNDFLNNSFGIILIDLISWSTSTIGFLINRAAGENYISTMTLRESAVNIGSLTNYQLRNTSAATVACEASLSTVQSADVLIPKGTVVRSSSEESLPFEVTQDYSILAGELTPRTPVVTISASLSGANVLSTFAIVVPGSVNVDLADSTINLKDFVQTGQTFRQLGTNTAYQIQDIVASPGAVNNNRLVLASAWEGTVQESIAAEVYDQRIQLVQGLTVVDRFVSPAANAPSFALKLSTMPLIDGSVIVEVNGETWDKVLTFAALEPDEQAYQVKVLASGEPIILFGDGSFGQIIPSEATIVVTYRVGGGTDGNIALNAINTSITGLISSTVNPVTINLTNQTSTGTGGRNAETLEEARGNIPACTRANDRAVTLEDYQTIAQGFSGVVFARSAIRTENALLEGNIVFVYAWTTGANGGLVALSPQSKLALEDYLQTKAVGTDLVRIADGTDRPFPVSLRFKVFDGFNVSDTQALVQDTLNNFVDVLRPGQPILYSNLVRALDEVFGVDTINMATPITDLFPSNPLELFTRAKEDFVYDLQKISAGTPVSSTTDGGNISLYTAQLPVFPVDAWSIRLFLGVNEMTVVPGLKPGFAQLYGQNLSVNTEVDSQKNLVYGSTVNLLTGQLNLWIKGVPGDFTLKLIPISGYAQDRLVNIYVGYTGDTSQTKRREIRSAIRAWGDGLKIGSSLYGREVSGITVSKSNITVVINSVIGVITVNRVALDTPGSIEDRVDALDIELLRIGTVVLNNETD